MHRIQIRRSPARCGRRRAQTRMASALREKVEQSTSTVANKNRPRPFDVGRLGGQHVGVVPEVRELVRGLRGSGWPCQAAPAEQNGSDSFRLPG